MTSPIVKEVIRGVNNEVREKVVSEAYERTDFSVKLTWREKSIKRWHILVNAYRRTLNYLRREIEKQKSEGVMPPAKILPGPAVDESLKYEGFSSPPRGCKLYEFDIKNASLQLAIIENTWTGQYDDKGNKIRKKSVFKKEGCVYFWALNMKKCT